METITRSAVSRASKNLPERALFAFNTNIDAVAKIKGKRVAKTRLPPKLRTLLQCMLAGSQREVAIGLDELVFLLRNFKPFEFRAGGQAGNGARAAARLGVKSLLHSASKASQQMALLNEKNIFIATPKGFENPTNAVSTDIPLIHVVLEFEKGDRINNKKISRSNRFIASFDPYNTEMLIDENFKHHAQKEIARLDKAFVSGFHLLARDDFEKKIDGVCEVVRDWTSANKNLEIYTELGDFQNENVARAFVKKFLPLCDCVGMDERELNQIKRTLRIKQNNLARAALAVLQKTEIETILIHTPELALAASRKHGALSLSDSLVFASVLAALKAKTGETPTLREIMDFSARAAKIEAKGIKSRFANARVPSFFIENPKSTVALGDCFAAGFFLTLR
ncbi:MAG: ADP-dependent glucokinase/phosphofructokinase [Candidatus Micrarchaeota archaeon]